MFPARCISGEIALCIWTIFDGRRLNLNSRLKLFLAQGFGIGRIPFAPGTFGSLLGLLWAAVLLLPRNLWIFALGTLAGLAVSVWLCGEGELILGKKDPGSVVLDEITVMPLCFFGWLAILAWRTGALPRPGYFVSSHHWRMTALVSILFRVADIAKPWPVRQSQRLPGGWGVTIDDALAGVYVNAVICAIGLNGNL